MWLCVELLAAALCAQTGVGQIQGTISDASGAVVPNASVLLENIQTDSPFRTVTNEAGLYVFPSLTPGDYRLTITVPGMQKWEGKATLVAGQRAVMSVSSKLPGPPNRLPSRRCHAIAVHSSSPTVATVVERARIEQLPLNGRSIQTLLTIAVPGLEGSTSQPKVYGLRDSAMDVSQDGVTLQDRNTGGDSVTPAGTRHGRGIPRRNGGIQRPADAPSQRHDDHSRVVTNEVHGSIFETGRNSGFGVARQRQDTFTKAPHLVRNEFGASLGGPVYLPKIYNGKNRTFVFASWEELRQRQASTTTSAVWTDAMRRGDFSGLVDSQNRVVTLYDPWSVGPGPNYIKTPFTGNQLPLFRESPLAK